MRARISGRRRIFVKPETPYGPLFLWFLPAALILPSFQDQTSKDAEDVYLRVVEGALGRMHRHIEKSAQLWEDHSTWDKAWEVRSEHYIVKTTRSYAFGRDIGQGLDVMSGHFRNLIKPGFVIDTPFKIFVFPDLAAYNALGQAEGNDPFATHSSIYGSFFSASHAERPVACLQHANHVLVNMWVTHSAVHQFLNRAFPGFQVPIWVDEGLAGYFSLYWDWEFGKSEFERLKGLGRLIPLQRLLQARIQNYVGPGQADDRFLQLGMLFNYLLHYRGDTKSTPDANGVYQGPFADYLRRVLNGAGITVLMTHPVQRVLFGQTRKLQADFYACKF